MRDVDVEQLWYSLWLIKAVVSVTLFWAVALLCKRVLRLVPWKRVRKHKIVQSVGTQGRAEK